MDERLNMDVGALDGGPHVIECGRQGRHGLIVGLGGAGGGDDADDGESTIVE